MNKHINSLIKYSKKILIKHGVILFIGLTVVICGYLLYKTYSYKNNSPTVNTNQTQALKINKQTVDKLNSLKDNSVEVRAIFNNARDNPF